jgi:hypothetical protein
MCVSGLELVQGANMVVMGVRGDRNDGLVEPIAEGGTQAGYASAGIDEEIAIPASH